VGNKGGSERTVKILKGESLSLDFGVQGNRKPVIRKHTVMEASVLRRKKMKWEVRPTSKGRNLGVRD